MPRPLKITGVIEASTTNDYWFVRTDNGSNFSAFVKHNFIGIGWNEITIEDVKHKTDHEVKEKIIKTYNLKGNPKSVKQKSTDIYNKIVKFSRLKQGDIVVIPSKSSQNLSFGEIVDTAVFSAQENITGCKYIKRRKVRWLTTDKHISTLDPIFYKIRKAMHTISSINDYQDHIDNVLYDVYTKGLDSHVVLRINATSDINLLKLAEVLQGIHNVMTYVNAEFSLGEDISQGTIKLHIQSPGIANLKQTGLALLLGATLLGLASCNTNDQTPATKQKLDNCYNDNRHEIDSLRTNIRDLHIK